MGAAGGGAALAALAARRAVLAQLGAARASASPSTAARRACASASASAADAASSSSSASSLVVRLAERFAKACLLIYAFTHHVGFPSLVTGPSMFPAFAASGEVVLAECLPGLPSRVKKGDVVICVRPVDASEHIVKRVAAVAGETVTVYYHSASSSSSPNYSSTSSSSSSSSSPSSSFARSLPGRAGGGGGMLYTGGALGAPPPAGGAGEGGRGGERAAARGPVRLTVPPGHVWVQGDNLAVSRDSREYGPVPLGTVRGRVLCTVWPLPRAVDDAVSPFGGSGARRPR